MKKSIIAGLAFLLLFGSLSFAGEGKMTRIERQDLPSLVGYVQNEFIVVVTEEARSIDAVYYGTAGKSGVNSLDILASEFDVEYLKPQFISAVERGIPKLSQHYKVRFSNVHDLEEVMEAYSQDPYVERVEPIGVHTAYATPNDFYFSYQWHMNQASDHDIDAPEAWDIETGDESVIVVILDTGVRYYHPDLGGANGSPSNPGASRGNMWINTAELNGSSGVDDDGNGYTDDWIGWDFVNGASDCYPGEDCNTQDNDPRDFNGHGTHCVGNVCMLTNDGYGMTGVAGGWHSGSQPVTGNGVRVMACRIGWSATHPLYGEVGYVRMDFAAEAFYYAADNGATIASCSWGSSNSGGLEAAVDYFLGNGGLIFKSAGNSGNQTADYMCGRTDVISVVATDQNDCKASFSTYGTWADISAPGVEIWSTYHDHTDPNTNYWASMDGTSMASPLAAGVGALIWSKNPGWTAAQVEQQLYDSADDIDGLACNSAYAGKLGAGRINAYNAVSGGCDLVADFTANVLTGCAPLTVNFTDLSTGTGIDSWNWTFGDGGTSTTQNPSYAYNTPGTYTVALTVSSSSQGCNATETKTNYITVQASPTADFVGSPTGGSAPLTVNFTDLSTGNPDTWSWDFGDGGTSTAQNPTYEYQNMGIYTVTLTASNACGSDIATKVDYIDVTEPQPETKVYALSDIPVVGVVTGDYTSTHVSDNGYEVLTEIEYTGHPRKRYSYLEHKWNFNLGGGGSNMLFFLEAYRPANTDGDNFTFAYSTDDATYYDMISVASGTEQVYSYALPAGLTGTVYVRVLDSNRSWDYTSLDPVYIDQMYFQFESGPVPPMAEFSGSPTSGTVPLTVTFTDLSTGNPDTWDWTFGDGGTSTAQHPVYEYTALGKYTVTLTVTNAYGTDSETKIDYITVTEAGNTMYVFDMVVGRVKAGPNYLGTGTVTIYDNLNNPVSGATVYANYDGPTSGSTSGVTGGDGTIELQSSGMKKPSGEWCFEVTNVTHATYIYDSGANNVTRSCESGDVYWNGESVTLLSVPEEFSVTNFPNPFNPEAEIQYSLPVSTPVTLEIFNVVGQRIATLVNETRSAGYHTVTWNASDVPSGVYFYRILAGEFTATNKMILMK
jgi:PKD repeat protein